MAGKLVVGVVRLGHRAIDGEQQSDVRVHERLLDRRAPPRRLRVLRDAVDERDLELLLSERGIDTLHLDRAILPPVVGGIAREHNRSRVVGVRRPSGKRRIRIGDVLRRAAGVVRHVVIEIVQHALGRKLQGARAIVLHRMLQHRGFRGRDERLDHRSEKLLGRGLVAVHGLIEKPDDLSIGRARRAHRVRVVLVIVQR